MKIRTIAIAAVIGALLHGTAAAQTHADIVRALETFWPGSHWSLSGADCKTLKWLDETPAPTCDDLMKAIEKLPDAPIFVPSSVLLGRFTAQEYTGILQAASAQLAQGNGALMLWIDKARVAPLPGIQVNGQEALAAKAALVAAGLLTQQRADVIFAP